MKLTELNKIIEPLHKTATMPAMFIGHGNPMNAIEENEFTQGWRQVAKTLPLPNAILCISAHWQTKGTSVTAMNNPATIHDFYGFPKALFEVNYPASGEPQLAKEVKSNVQKTTVELANDWGLDHGCWAPVMHMFPKADIPIIQLSLDYTKPAAWHFELSKELAFLRQKGVLIIGSGNMVHNLKMVDWAGNVPSDWATEANEKIIGLATQSDFKPLINYQALGSAMSLAVPTPEHYLPLLYVLALKEAKEEAALFNNKITMGSISMASLKIG